MLTDGPEAWMDDRRKVITQTVIQTMVNDYGLGHLLMAVI